MGYLHFIVFFIGVIQVTPNKVTIKSLKLLLCEVQVMVIVQYSKRVPGIFK